MCSRPSEARMDTAHWAPSAAPPCGLLWHKPPASLRCWLRVFSWWNRATVNLDHSETEVKTQDNNVRENTRLHSRLLDSITQNRSEVRLTLTTQPCVSITHISICTLEKHLSSHLLSSNGAFSALIKSSSPYINPYINISKLQTKALETLIFTPYIFIPPLICYSPSSSVTNFNPLILAEMIWIQRGIIKCCPIIAAFSLQTHGKSFWINHQTSNDGCS